MSACDNLDSHRSLTRVSPTGAQLAQITEEEKTPITTNEEKGKIPKLNLEQALPSQSTKIPHTMA